MSQQIQNMFSNIASTYDQANHQLSFNKDVEWRKASVAQMARGGFAPNKVLDLCAGTGDFALAVKEKFPSAQVILADFARPMLALAKGKSAGQGGVDLLQADALKVPFQDMAFDTVVCGFGVRNLDSVETGLKEMARVLKPGGKAAILEFFRPTGLVTRLVYGFYIGTLLPMRGGAIAKNKDAYDYLQRSAQKFLTVGQMKDLMEKNGFKDVTVEAQTLGIAHSLVGVRR